MPELSYTAHSSASVLVFGFYAWVLPGWMIKAGSLLVMMGTPWIVWQLSRRACAASLPESSGMVLLEFHRQELLRQRNAAKSVAWWYIAPVIPGVVMMTLGRYFQFHAPGRTLAWDHQIVILCFAIVALTFAIVWLLNAWAAERPQRRIDELDKLGGA